MRAGLILKREAQVNGQPWLYHQLTGALQQVTPPPRPLKDPFHKPDLTQLSRKAVGSPKGKAAQPRPILVSCGALGQKRCPAQTQASAKQTLPCLHPSTGFPTSSPSNALLQEARWDSQFTLIPPFPPLRPPKSPQHPAASPDSHSLALPTASFSWPCFRGGYPNWREGKERRRMGQRKRTMGGVNSFLFLSPTALMMEPERSSEPLQVLGVSWIKASPEFKS